MNDRPKESANALEEPKSEDDPRAAALRANLAKRKQQASARRGGKAVGKKEPSVFDRLKDGED
jgi:hypothetical protein